MEGNNKKANTSSIDVISTLPDNVRSRILAFLTTKEAALALFLSKRCPKTLQRLVYRRDDDASGPKPCVMFDTPGLVYLEYSNVVADKYENLR
ncbi:hypothetical protein F2Q68_00017591 [Brassica cretica]|uniref:F-box domain-containing protein n=1 Tax=Brassica cretica TaxID=69181 RepID=A0A8S9HWA1_BRACR|nr:hypothetical protein F2Q68_00017591 [Brassica cretica]